MAVERYVARPSTYPGGRGGKERVARNERSSDWPRGAEPPAPERQTAADAERAEPPAPEHSVTQAQNRLSGSSRSSTWLISVSILNGLPMATWTPQASAVLSSIGAADMRPIGIPAEHALPRQVSRKRQPSIDGIMRSSRMASGGCC